MFKVPAPTTPTFIIMFLWSFEVYKYLDSCCQINMGANILKNREGHRYIGYRLVNVVRSGRVISCLNFLHLIIFTKFLIGLFVHLQFLVALVGFLRFGSTYWACPEEDSICFIVWYPLRVWRLPLPTLVRVSCDSKNLTKIVCAGTRTGGDLVVTRSGLHN